MKNIPLILVCIFTLFFLKKRFFDNTNYKQMIVNGGIIVDVRSEAEFVAGHIEKSLNIPLSGFKSNLKQIQNKNQPIITCCASGVRSAVAAKILLAKGYTNVVNGGGWSRLERKLEK